MRNDLEFTRVGAIIREAAETLIRPRFRHLGAEAVTVKTHAGDLVTVADLEAEAFLTQKLTELLPGSAVLGEEAVYQDSAIGKVLDGDAPVWIIDPVDGTANFARGLPAFGVIVALVQHRRTLAGWILDPLSDRLYTAAVGSGAWCDGRRLRTGGRGRRELAALSGCISRRMAERKRHLFGEITQQGSAAHDYMSLSEGRLDFRLFRLLNPWDHAAGVLLVEEAGGYVRLLSGTPYTPVFHPHDSLLIATDAATWAEVREALGI